MQPSHSYRTRFALTVYVLCFGIGAFNHAMDFVRWGWRPYRWGPVPLEIFWSSLVVVDVLVIGLLLAGRWQAGLSLALAIMTTDVLANLYALFALDISAFAEPIILQATFPGFVLGSISFLWPDRLGAD